MGFLYPQFLFALFFLLIPIIIHFFNFQRTQKVFFTNLAFLSKVKEQHSNRFKLKRLLILLARLSFMALLILAFAQPYWKQKNVKQEGQVVRAVYLDNSLSMQAKNQNEALLNQGIRYVTDLIQWGKKTVLTSILSNQFSGKSQYFYKQDLALESLTEINYSPQHRSLSSVLKRQKSAFDHLNLSNTSLEQYVLTDFQKSTIGDLEKISLDTTHQISLIPLQAEQVGNVFIDSVWLISPFIRLGENNQLWVRMRNGGDEDVEDLTLQLSIDQLHKSSVTVNVPANGEQEVMLNFSLEKSGLKSCKIAFEDFPVDFDNEYHFVLMANAKVNIAIIDEESISSIKQVYNHEEVFNPVHLSIDNIDFNALKNADLVILSHISSWSIALTEALDEIVARGGSVLIIPNEKIDASFLNAWMINYALPSVTKREIEEEELQEMALLDYKNPFFNNVFDEELSQMQMPKANPLLSIPSNSSSLLRFHTSKSFINSYDVKNGKVYICTSPLEEEYTNFHKHALFVPIMYKIATESSPVNTRLAYHLDQSFLNIRGDFHLNSTKPYTLVGPQGQMIPEQQIVNQELFLELPNDFRDIGVFDLTQGDSLVTKIAINTSKKESRLSMYSQEKLTEIFEKYSNVQVLDLKTAIAQNNFIKNQVEGFPLWKYSLILCLLFLLIEIALIRFL